MPADTRRFRLFVSSTFRDFVAEREALRRDVYPRLRDLCEAHGATFEAVDLRWGVSREAAEHHRTMAICLAEVDRCTRTTERPNFLLLLGDRLGWRPLPAKIPADVLAQLVELLGRDPAHARAAELLDAWYRGSRDDNAVPPVHLLAVAERSAADEAELRRALDGVLDGVPAEHHAALVGGATEQEVRRRLALAPIGGGRAVVASRRIVDGLDERATAFADVEADGRPDRAAAERHRRLRHDVESLAGDELLAYDSQWSGSEISRTHLEPLCRDVHARLSAAVGSALDTHARTAPAAREDELHAAFAAERGRDFHGREEILGRLRAWTAGPGGPPLVVHGPSGSGKTTLIAHALAGPLSPHGAELVLRFVGATAASSSPRNLLGELCARLAALKDETGYAVPDRVGDLVADLRRLLRQWPAERRLVLVLDAVDQLEGDARDTLAWIDDELPASVHVLLSVVDGPRLELLARLAPRAHRLAVGRMAAADAGTALHAWLASGTPPRTLQPEQRAAVLGAFDRTGLPLHLRLLYEQARTWTSSRRPGELPTSVPATIEALFDALSASEHGSVLVQSALSYLAAARDGLTSTELVDVLSADPETMRDFHERQPPESPPTDVLPPIVWTRLLFDLDAYLAERERLGTATLDFFHRQFRDVVVRRWLDPAAARRVHRRLAAYFAGLDTWLRRPDGTVVPNRRKLAELPYQYAQAGQWREAEALLTDPGALRGIVEALGPAELVDDLDRILEPSRRTEVEAELGGVEHLGALRRAALASSPVVSADPAQLPSQLFGRIGVEHASLRERLLGWTGPAWLQPLRPTLEAGPLRFTLLGHGGTVRSVAVSHDGRWSATAGNSSPDRTVRVWSLERGEQVRVLEGLAAAGEETPLAFESTGDLLVGAGPEVRRVDVLSGQIDRVLLSDAGAISCLAAAASAPVAAAGAGHRLWIWPSPDAEGAGPIDVGAPVARVAVTGDGRRVAVLTPEGVVLVDPEQRSPVARCERPIDCGSGFSDRPPLALSPGGDTVSFGRDLVTWHPGTGVVEEVVRAAQAAVWIDAPRAVLALTPDGRRALVSPGLDDHRDMAIAAGESRWIARWAPGSGATEAIIRGPGSLISVAALSPDGELAVVAHFDHSVRVWELGRPEDRSLDAHDNPVVAIRIDGELATSRDQGNVSLSWSLLTGALEQDETGAPRKPPGATDPPLPPVAPAASRSERWATSADGRVAVRYDSPTDKLSEAPDPPDPPDSPLPFGVFDVRAGGELAERFAGAPGPEHRLTRVAVSPDGRIAIAAGWGSLRVFDLERGRQRFRLEGHAGPVWSVALAGDSPLAVSASEDATLRLWDIEAGRCVATFSGESPMRACAAALLPGESSPTCVAGEDSGRVHILRPRRERE